MALADRRRRRRAAAGGGGLVNDLMQAANQLGASQAIDLLKGLVMPAIMQGVQRRRRVPRCRRRGCLPAARPCRVRLPGAAGALPGAAGALPGAAGALPRLPLAPCRVPRCAPGATVP